MLRPTSLSRRLFLIDDDNLNFYIMVAQLLKMHRCAKSTWTLKMQKIMVTIVQ